MRKRPRSERSERWQREDAAVRLIAEVPALRTLSLILKDSVDESSVLGKGRTQHIVVERAAALFEVACAERKCEGGGYDLTAQVMSVLRRHETHFEGTAHCSGTVGQGYCRCMLAYVVCATYDEA